MPLSLKYNHCPLEIIYHMILNVRYQYVDNIPVPSMVRRTNVGTALRDEDAETRFKFCNVPLRNSK
jgi:hypothetical protein